VLTQKKIPKKKHSDRAEKGKLPEDNRRESQLNSQNSFRSPQKSSQFFFCRPPKRAFACSVSSNGKVCSRLAVNSDFSSLSLRSMFNERKTTGYGHMEISRASTAILIVISVFGYHSRSFFFSFLCVDGVVRSSAWYLPSNAFFLLKKKLTYHD
jgi:hypothetical protein